MRLHVLIVDDEKNIRSTLRAFLESIECKVSEVANQTQLDEMLTRENFDVTFLDLKLGDASGIDLLPTILQKQPETCVIIMTAYATVDTAVRAMQLGAADYLPKPFAPSQISHLINRVSERRTLENELHYLRNQNSSDVGEKTKSPAMKAALDLLERAAAHDVPVILTGENGTGKSVLAQLLHRASQRKQRAFVTINCPTLSEELLASELFGHARGAFTGAVKDQPGRVEIADGGTLFFDEIGELPLNLQAKLLRFMQDKAFERVGESKTRTADVRILAATNRNLEDEVRQGRFREDLVYRLNTFEVVVPPLRERKEDLPQLIAGFLGFFSRTAKVNARSLDSEANQILLGYSWPGNVRELRNVIERAVIVAPGEIISPQHLPSRIVGQSSDLPYIGGDYSLEQIEHEHILRVIAKTKTLEEAARVLGIEVSTLWRKRKRYEEDSGAR